MKNSNYTAQELLEKWIVVKNHEGILVTRRSNFEETKLCECYADYGNKVNCYQAGCYSLDNSSSNAQSDCSSAITDKFNVCVSLEKCANDWSVIPADDDHAFSDELISEIESFIKIWQQENESHVEVTAWSFHDSHNFCTIVLKSEFGEPDVEELDEDEQLRMLLEMPERTPHMDGFNTSEETENFIFKFDRFATNPWFCEVEVK